MEPVTPRTTVFAVELISWESSKLHAPSSKEAPNSKHQTRQRDLLLVFEVWCFPGAWSVELGVFFGSRQFQPPAQIPFRPHYVSELLQILLHRFADDRV